MSVGSAIALIFASIFSCYMVMFSKIERKVRASRFLGQVAGFLAGLSSSVPCFYFCAADIYGYCKSQYERCSLIKRQIPSPESDPIYYASQGQFALFSLLCAQEYAGTANISDTTAKEILSFCRENLVLSGNLTSGISSPWD